MDRCSIEDQGCSPPFGPQNTTHVPKSLEKFSKRCSTFAATNQAIPCLERMALTIDDQITCATMNEIDFILLVRGLRVMAGRRVILDRHRAVSGGVRIFV